MMKVLTKNVLIEGEEFFLISDIHEGQKYYGTIPYSEVENGRLKRQLNGFEMCISFEGIPQAIERREKHILIERFKKEGHTEEELLNYCLQVL